MQNEQDKIMYYPKKQFLCCRLCTDIFKKPITLGCGHTFCYYCLYKFMRQQCDDKNLNAKQVKPARVEIELSQESLKEQQIQSKKDESIPLPLCPTCSSLIFKPIKFYKQNLTLTNLISHAKYVPALKFDNQVYDETVQNFDHKILIRIQDPKIQPLPGCHSMIRFSTCFLDDMLQQSHSSYVVVQWPNFTKNIGLAGKIQRVEVEYHSSSSRNKQNHYRAYFTGLFFVKIQNRKTIEINLRSRYYVISFSLSKTEALFSTQENQYAKLTICKCQQFHSSNILPIHAFNQFFAYYDTLNNPHYLNQIYKLVDPTPLFQRNNTENMIYSCIRILKLKPYQRKQIIQSFDDHFRIIKINQFLQKVGHLQLQEIFQISIPGKYNSAFVFGVIIFLIILHYLQNQSATQ